MSAGVGARGRRYQRLRALVPEAWQFGAVGAVNLLVDLAVYNLCDEVRWVFPPARRGGDQ